LSSSYLGASQSIGKIPASFAIALAVYKLSPVTIRVFTPAFLRVSTAFLIPFLRGSAIPTIILIVRFYSKESFPSTESKAPALTLVSQSCYS